MVYLLVLLAVVSYCVASIIKKQLQANGSQFKTSDLFALEYVGSFFIYLLFVIFTGKLILPSGEQIPWLILHAIVWSVFSYVNIYSLKELPASAVSLIESSKFIWILLASIFIFAENITTFDYLGLLIIASTVILSNKSSKNQKTSRKAIGITILNASLLAACFIVDKYLCTIGIPIETMLISVCLVPSILIICCKNFSIKKTIQISRTKPKSFLIPVFEAIGYFLIISAFLIGGNLLTVSILAESEVIVLLLIEFFVIKSCHNFSNRFTFACLNILGISLVVL